jgi:D-alanine transaminase
VATSWMTKGESCLTRAAATGMTLASSHDVLVNLPGRTLAMLHGGRHEPGAVEPWLFFIFVEIASARMSRVAYVNGRYVLHRDAMVHIEDRGYQFADGVYEVCEVFRGALIDERRHFERLAYSLAELQIAPPVRAGGLKVVVREVMARNRVENGFVYVQVTRGVAPRDHVFPQKPARPSLVVTARQVDPEKSEINARKGISVITTPDLRWKRVDIKTISLLPNVLARQLASERGASEAWFVDSLGMVTEGAASNAWIINKAGVLVTRQLDHSILRGVTRTTLIEIVAAEGLKLEERKFSLEEVFAAREAFITGATTLIMPVVRIDGREIGAGIPGPIASKLRAIFHAAAARSVSL